MIDARFEAARRTNQSGGRGWDFAPDASDREPSRFGVAVAVLAALCVCVSLLGSVM